ncbi:MAG: DUF1292 domain-containing protein [Syntrophomonadaceae bacterium]|jgi:uncharacterized protein YrzB (UPF0473 family)|nr:DUF1292 domain-containing protein [Syntrophomonadaceae bacterium]
MSDEELFEEEYPVLVLVDEEGTEMEFELIAELDIQESKYRVLLPLDEFFFEEDEDDAEGELEGGGVVIFKVMYDDEGNEYLADIDDDEEWEMVADVWQELAENEEI